MQFYIVFAYLVSTLYTFSRAIHIAVGFFVFWEILGYLGAPCKCFFVEFAYLECN